MKSWSWKMGFPHRRRQGYVSREVRRLKDEGILIWTSRSPHAPQNRRYSVYMCSWDSFYDLQLRTVTFESHIVHSATDFQPGWLAIILFSHLGNGSTRRTWWNWRAKAKVPSMLVENPHHKVPWTQKQPIGFPIWGLEWLEKWCFSDGQFELESLKWWKNWGPKMEPIQLVLR